MSARWYYAVLISVFSFCACESNSIVYDSTDLFGCTRDEQCVSRRCLSSGECAKLMRIGEACDSWGAVCMEGLKCESNKCVWETGAVDRCLVDRDCGEKQVCYEEGCVRTDGACRHDFDCVFRKTESVCMPNGKCGHYLEAGEVCGEETYCKIGYECRDVCVELLEEGASCIENDTLHVCNEELGLKCFDGECHKYETGRGLGNTCNDSYLNCNTGLTCKDGVCVQLVEESEACN